MKKIEKLAEEYVLKARAYYNDDEMRAQATCYTDGIRRGIEMCRELCPSSPADPSCRRSQIDMLIKELEQNEQP